MKRQVKKLSLNMETLRLLESNNLVNVAGGVVASNNQECNTNAINCNTQAVGCTATHVCSGCGPCF
jgi:hypothetical protein